VFPISTAKPVPLQIRREFSGIRGFFCIGPVLGSFFPIGPDERLRSFNETASYVSNSSVDSLGRR
jgi:hypothetical protein